MGLTSKVKGKGKGKDRGHRGGRGGRFVKKDSGVKDSGVKDSGGKDSGVFTELDADRFFEELTHEATLQIKGTVEELMTMPKSRAEELFKTTLPMYQEVVLSTFPELRVKFALGEYPVMRIDDEKYMRVSFPSLSAVTKMLEIMGEKSLSGMTDEKLELFLGRLSEDEELYKRVVSVVFGNYEEGDERYISLSLLEVAVRDFFTALRFRKYLSPVRWKELESRLESLYRV